MKKIFQVLLLVMIGLWAETPKAIIIFDASGSMWGQIQGKSKIEIAREALKNVVQEWNPSVELGVTAYGHRTKGDCNDIEAVIPLGKINKREVIDRVMHLQPKGKTPISRSLRKAAEELAYTEEKATIILISDGKETCDPDPCGTAKALKEKGIDFVTHVIGFNVDNKTDKQLACIAHATGGTYFSAKNAKTLNDAIKTVSKKIEKSKPVITETLLQTAVHYDMAPRGENVRGGKWSIIQGDQHLYEGDDTSPQVKAKVGKVMISYIYEKASVPQRIVQEIMLKPQEKEALLLLLQSGQVTVDAAEEQGGVNVKSFIQFYPVIEGSVAMDKLFASCETTKSKACKEVLPIGEYLIVAHYNGMEAKQRFTLQDEEQKRLHLYFKKTGKVEVFVSEKESGPWVKAYNTVFKDENGKPGKSVATPHSGRTNAGKAQLPVGKYIIKTRYNKFEKFTPFEVKEGETNKIHIVMGETGKVEVFVSEKESGPWVKAYNTVFKDENGKPGKSVATPHSGRTNAGKAQLPVGKYIVRTRCGKSEKLTPFEVKAGDTTKVHIVFSPLFIEPVCMEPSEKVKYEIYADNGRLIFAKKVPCAKKIKVVLAEGNYTLKVTGNNQKTEKHLHMDEGVEKIKLDLKK